ncbi:glycosyltransferase family 4 protein [Stella sp.]|uniref:glycosyltransferase family 4 protein n=1 Tax=Stella sp. TaxID=2912054 RepID=UPI0035B137BF
MPTAADTAPLPAIRYSSRDLMAGRPLIVGLTVATQTFFEAYVRNHPGRTITGYVRDQATYEDMKALIGEITGRPELARGIGPRSRDMLAQCGAVLMQDPAIEREARHRRDPRAYSLIGLTHSLSSRESWGEIQRYALAPLQPWDALVCTSRAARAVVDRLLDAADEALARAGLPSPVPRPARPIIPLGIDAPRLAGDPERRAAWRARHGIAADAVVVLFFGRLSMHAKAHPFAMFTAVGEAARALGRPLEFVLAGQFATGSIRQAFQGLADDVSDAVRTTFVENPDNDERRSALSGADIFLSLADSIQETFGLAPVEAMAAGLPVVVTDWDGYRDTVRDGIEGFRIPTMMAPPPAARGAQRSYLGEAVDYDRFCAVMGQMVSVDIRAAAAAIRGLAADPERRREMGAAGVERARALFDWPAVMQHWRQLWTGLAEIRAAAPATRPPTAEPFAIAPPDPLDLFRSFPTRMVGEDDRVRLTNADAAAVVAACREAGSFRYAFAHLPAADRFEALLAAIARRPDQPVRDLLAAFPGQRRAEVLRMLLFLGKRDLVRIAAPAAAGRYSSAAIG